MGCYSRTRDLNLRQPVCLHDRAHLLQKIDLAYEARQKTGAKKRVREKEEKAEGAVRETRIGDEKESPSGQETELSEREMDSEEPEPGECNTPTLIRMMDRWHEQPRGIRSLLL